eukprot:SAG11_NODE_8373_length_1023_cov_3.317100_1_plen_30_part_01
MTLLRPIIDLQGWPSIHSDAYGKLYKTGFP